ncbi:MAG: helix-turn-helix transcriptional regulator [Alphaproteobacteria bacterium]|nr:helix-turn-helix transcriptional regulator [Alphaproteobacteria bacterium]MBL7098760.1 helix-turn-helix transcriptional regulator [Alphaproteobacteria bacterium]
MHRAKAKFQVIDNRNVIHLPERKARNVEGAAGEQTWRLEEFILVSVFCTRKDGVVVPACCGFKEEGVKLGSGQSWYAVADAPKGMVPTVDSTQMTDATIPLLAQKDYDAISMVRIAKEVACSVGALYARFAEKTLAAPSRHRLAAKHAGGGSGAGTRPAARTGHTPHPLSQMPWLPCKSLRRQRR